MTLKRDPDRDLIDFLENKWDKDFGLDSKVDVHGTDMLRDAIIQEMRNGSDLGRNYYNNLFNLGLFERWGYAEEWQQYRKQHKI